MGSTESLPIRLGRPSPVGRRTVLVGLALLAAILPVALLGVALMALRHEAQLPAPPEGSARMATLAPGVEVVSVPSPFTAVVEHYVGAPGTSKLMTSAHTQVPLVGTVDRIVVSPLTAGQQHQGALVVSRGMGQVNWVLLFGSLKGGSTYAVSGREVARATEKPGNVQLWEWKDARLTDRGTCSSGPLAGGYFATHTPSTRAPLMWLWEAYSVGAGVPHSYAEGLSSGSAGDPLTMLNRGIYWTGTTSEDVRIGVIERRWSDHTVLVALFQAPGHREVEAFVAVL